MNVLAILKKRDDAAIRTSTIIRAEISGMPHLARHAELLAALEATNVAAAILSGAEQQEAERQVAGALADEAEYRGKHRRDFERSDDLHAELGVVAQRESEAIIAARMVHHAGPEAAECNRLVREATTAAQQALSQRVATHLQALQWGVHSIWSFGFQPPSVEARAREIMAAGLG